MKSHNWMLPTIAIDVDQDVSIGRLNSLLEIIGNREIITYFRFLHIEMTTRLKILLQDRKEKIIFDN